MNTIKTSVLAIMLALPAFAATAQRDSTRLPAKVLHAEPLFIDLIRDLGARKGEREWNVGMGVTDHDKFDEYTALVEYEFAPLNRLGLEVELPFTFYSRNQRAPNDQPLPGNRLNGLKLAAQYSFFVSEKLQSSLAVGYIHEFAMKPFNMYRHGLFSGHVFSPFFIAAKRWGSNFHTLIYTGPVLVREAGHIESSWQHNTSFHYLIPGSKNFLGIELNKEWSTAGFDMTVRPQFRLTLADNLLAGIVTGIPVNREAQRLSSFLRLIYEPAHRESRKKR
ncbi:phosphoribosylformylglycinamidine synthase [Pedobacter yulinensis]|uniref:Phosphoribosylformylglycinamidine synthase n=1 Tax=Pedobacter yulinensis TaxID=2126353 RepID=A0A2T3HMN7_9SPHI|nr:HAEPLYID family protein [Pedobacter yulinensis]PST83710.1 phosphoribosylformylglycinamidine synthase [Pedobacter yulinensis]